MVTTVDADSRGSALAAGETVYRAVADAEHRLSTWDASSELSRLNAAPAGRAVTVSDDLARDIEAALRCAAETGGAFTPGIGGLVRAWKLREGGRRPSRGEIEAAVSAASLDNLRVEDGRVTRLDPGFLIEEGAFGKGVGVDDALERLDETNASAAVIDLGGQVTVWGRATAYVEIAHPYNRDRTILRLDVSHGSVATSSNSERGIVVDGERLGHIVDPRTGQPSGYTGSVTVWASDATRADCLSTALYVLGPAAAHAWALRHPDVGVVTVEDRSGRLVAMATPKLRGRLTTLSEEVTVGWSAPESSAGKGGRSLSDRGEEKYQ
jgi:thiamine biosynthesis lipoprotein